MNRIITLIIGLLTSMNILAVTPAEDIAATININGYSCGSKASGIKESTDANGNKTITASCADGKKYKINISSKGRVTVKPN